MWEDVLLLVVDGGPVSGACHRDRVRRGVDRLERACGLDRNVDHHLPERGGGEPFGVERVAVAVDPGLRLQDLGVGEFDPTRLPRGDREDPGRDGISADVLEQSRIQGAAHVILVDLPRLIGGEHLSLQLFPVCPHGEVGDDRSGREGKNVLALDRV